MGALPSPLPFSLFHPRTCIYTLQLLHQVSLFKMANRTNTPGQYEEPGTHIDGRPEAVYGLLGKDLGFFSEAGFDMSKVTLKRNATVGQLYEDAVKDEGIVYEETSKDDIWWGTVNIKMDEHTFEINR